MNFVSIRVCFWSLLPKKAEIAMQMESIATCIQPFSLFNAFHRPVALQHLGQRRKKWKIRQFAKLGLQIHKDSSIRSSEFAASICETGGFLHPHKAVAANVAALLSICTTPAFLGSTDQKYIYTKSKIVSL
jgi:hypothetical protein